MSSKNTSSSSSGNGGGREVTHSGTNSQGNHYRAYNDGGYSYRNTHPATGHSTGNYFNTGGNSDFYRPNAGYGQGAWSRNSGPNGTGEKNYYEKK